VNTSCTAGDPGCADGGGGRSGAGPGGSIWDGYNPYSSPDPGAPSPSSGGTPSAQPTPKPLSPAQKQQVFRTIQKLLRSHLCRQAGQAAYALYPVLSAAAFSDHLLQGVVAHEAAARRQTMCMIVKYSQLSWRDANLRPIWQIERAVYKQESGANHKSYDSRY
jgi:hypothetical protein